MAHNNDVNDLIFAYATVDHEATLISEMAKRMKHLRERVSAAEGANAELRRIADDMRETCDVMSRKLAVSNDDAVAFRKRTGALEEENERLRGVVSDLRAMTEFRKRGKR